MCIYNGKNIGQIESIDVAYSHVTTPFIFHCEDDWEFYDVGFIEKSLEVFAKDPKVVTITLRAHNDTNGQPVRDIIMVDTRSLARNYDNFWHGSL
jgi:hypothetical protein